MFNDFSPTFDRKGKYLFYASSRSFTSPIYEDVGSSFVYIGTHVLLAVPLKADADYPWAPKSDEETWDDEEEEQDEEQDEAGDGQQDSSDEDHDGDDAEDAEEDTPADQDEADDDEPRKRPRTTA